MNGFVPHVRDRVNGCRRCLNHFAAETRWQKHRAYRMQVRDTICVTGDTGSIPIAPMRVGYAHMQATRRIGFLTACLVMQSQCHLESLHPQGLSNACHNQTQVHRKMWNLNQSACSRLFWVARGIVVCQPMTVSRSLSHPTDYNREKHMTAQGKDVTGNMWWPE